MISNRDNNVEASGDALRHNSNETVLDYFHRQVQLNPNNLAIVEGNVHLDYAALDKKARMLAARFLSDLREEEPFVAILLPQGIPFITTVLAILKTGKAYVPLCSDYPKKRVLEVLKDLRYPLLITEKNSDLHYHRACRPDEECEPKTNDSLPNLVGKVSGKDLVYAMYTSGSTGLPKGVMIEHHSLLNHALWMITTCRMTPEDKSLLFSTPSFDVSAAETWPFLCSGASLHIPPPHLRYNVKELREWVKVTGITITLPTARVGEEFCRAPPSQFSPSFKALLIGGEKTNLRLNEPLPFDLFHCYGPTECTINSTAKVIPAGELCPHLPNVGQPIWNYKVWVLNSETLAQVGIGDVGEVFIGGAGVARGYLNHPQLNEEKFLWIPWIGERVYRTGDLGRVEPSSGELEIIGRIGHQVKVHGFRVELEEIENALLAHPQVLHAFALYREDRLRAFVAVGPSSCFGLEEALSWLKQSLPPYAIPTILTILPQFPLTPQGKVDAVKLLELETQVTASGYIPPQTDAERRIAAVWSDILNIKQESIGRLDTFFQLGGNSLAGGRFISIMRREPFCLDVSVQHLFNNTNLSSFAKLMEEGGLQMKEKLEEASSPVVPVKESTPLSYLQEQIWLMTSELSHSDTTYNEHFCMVWSGEKLNLKALEASVQQVLKNHDILRTIFTIDPNNGLPMQVVNKDIPSQPMNRTCDETGFEELLEEELSRPFELEKGPLTRFILFAPGSKPSYFELHLVFHHILMDASGLVILEKELRRHYHENTASPNEMALRNDTGLRLQYADFCTSTNLLKESWKEAEAFFQTYLANAVPIIIQPDYILPTPTGIAGTRAGKNGSGYFLPFSPELSTAIKEFSRLQDTTVFITCLTGLNAIIYRLTGQTDLCTFIPVRVTSDAEWDEVIGHFVNVLPLRTELEGHESFLSSLRRVHVSHASVFARRTFPFQKLAQLLLQNGFQRENFFQFSVGMGYDPQSYSTAGRRQTRNLKYDLQLEFSESEAGVGIAFEYNADLYAEERMRRMGAYLELFLQQALLNPIQSLDTLDFIPEEESSQILHRFSQGPIVPCDPSLTVLDRFLRQVALFPDRTALIQGSTKISYEELDRMANGVKTKLELENDFSEFVAVLLPQGLTFLTTIIAILKAGKSYVPLSLDYPEERVSHILKELDYPVLVLNSDHSSNYHRKLVFGTETSRSPTTSPALRRSALAYCIFTSGSTGTPKGVLIRHSALYNYCDWKIREFQLSSDDRSLLITSPCFDVSAAETWPYLSVGATLVVPSEGIRADHRALRAVIRENHITTLETSTSLGELIYRETDVELGPQFRYLFTGGDKMTRYPPEDLPFTVINCYGPTETTIDASFLDLRGYRVNPRGQPPIGRPIQNTSIHILDDNLGLRPIGWAGEIFIGGEGLAQGYLNKPSSDAFLFKGGQKLYRTGDLGRWLPDGNTEFLGRKDGQIKLRGFRVELGEIESIFLQNSDVEEAVVLQDGDNLCAFVVTLSPNEAEKAGGKLRAFLISRLPYYAIPSQILILERLPLTLTGKLDRNALLALKHKGTELESNHAALSKYEKIVALVWSQVLNLPLEAIRADDNFFHLGGHSLLGVEMIYKLRQKPWSFPLIPSHIFQFPTVWSLARALGEGGLQDDDTNCRELGEDAILKLELNICADARELIPPKWKNVLLTGATGYIGSGLLHELLEKTSATVFCLVRAGSPSAGLERLKASQLKYGELETKFDRVVPLVGQLDAVNFGIPLQEYAVLTRTIDLIFHVGDDINFVKSYRDLRPTNVEGTLQVISFAAKSKLKPLHYMSTLGVVDICGGVFEEVPLQGTKGPVIGTGYDQSKWVAEKLVSAAGEEGLPVIVHRVGDVGPHSHLPIQPVKELFRSLHKAMFTLGSWPQDDNQRDTPYSSLDFVTAAIVHLAKGGKLHFNKVFNIFQVNIRYLEIIVRKYPWLQGVSSEEWVKALEDRMDEVEDGYFLHSAIHANSHGAKSLLEFMREGDVVCSNQSFMAALEGSGIALLDEEFLADSYLSTVTNSF